MGITSRTHRPGSLVVGLVLVAGTVAGPGAVQPRPEGTILVRAARVIDGRGGPPIAAGGVLIKGDRIEQVDRPPR